VAGSVRRFYPLAVITILTSKLFKNLKNFFRNLSSQAFLLAHEKQVNIMIIIEKITIFALGDYRFIA
jgi:hypothetical protein